MLLPLLTVLDETTSLSEGSIDPLGLYSIADALGVRLAPGVRERQRRPRFLTAICVSHVVCRQVGPDRIAKDNVSAPWQVFEWYVVEGLVRRIAGEARLRDLPGREKASQATLRDRVPLSARRYLKNPAVTGFHGVYRGLAKEMRLEHSEQLFENGFQLVDVWEREQRLEGFWSSRTGAGRSWRDKLAQAVEAGLESGGTARSASWEGWDFFARHLAHDNPGKSEQQLLSRFLMEDHGGFRREVLQFLISVRGQEVWRPDQSRNERPFHQALVRVASTGLRELLTAIDAYERFARRLTDAFYECLFAMTQAAKAIPVSHICDLPSVVTARQHVPLMFAHLQEAANPVRLGERLPVFAPLAEPLPAAEWTERLLSHHDTVQKNKPPSGKAPWVVRFDDGRYLVRPQYQVENYKPAREAYVHQYRTGPLNSFAWDLGMVK